MLNMYYVYYHRRGQGIRKFNMMRTVVSAKTGVLAIKAVKRELGLNFVIERAEKI